MKDTKYGDVTQSTMTMKVGDLVISSMMGMNVSEIAISKDVVVTSIEGADIGIVLDVNVSMLGEEVIPTGVTILLDSGEIETTWEDDFEVINEER